MEGVKYTLAHPEEAVQMLKKHQPQLDEKTAVQEIAIIRKLINADNAKGPIGAIDKTKMQATQDLMVKYLDLKDPPPVADTFTNEFLT
jgi:NitT/TauT family transport system substrate-binding protein